MRDRRTRSDEKHGQQVRGRVEGQRMWVSVEDVRQRLRRKQTKGSIVHYRCRRRHDDKINDGSWYERKTL